ncbi:MAG: hypothetical protein L0Z48_12495 [candidate division Zixibacteria bacterium]|nr:hypothetical protein [candidate division Zixibacteria bacterium]
MKRGRTFLAVGLSGFLAAGCGAMFGGSRQTVYVDSSPPANVTVTQTGMTQTTPTTLSLARKDSYVLTIQKQGYETRRVEVERKMRGGILAMDILLTGLLGVVVDAATGSWWKLVPERVDVTLPREATGSLDLPETVRVQLGFSEGDEFSQSFSVTADQPGVVVTVEKAKN